jgi:hypothetical protein
MNINFKTTFPTKSLQETHETGMILALSLSLSLIGGRGRKYFFLHKPNYLKVTPQLDFSLLGALVEVFFVLANPSVLLRCKQQTFFSLGPRFSNLYLQGCTDSTKFSSYILLSFSILIAVHINEDKFKASGDYNSSKNRIFQANHKQFGLSLKDKIKLSDADLASTRFLPGGTRS